MGLLYLNLTTMTSLTQQEKDFLEVYQEHSDAVFRYCYWQVFDAAAAENIVQKSFCRALTYVNFQDFRNSLMILVYQMAGNIINESQKTPMAFFKKIVRKVFLSHSYAQGKIRHYFIDQEITHAIQSLDQRQKDAIILKYISGLSVDQISNILHQPEDAIEQSIQQGLLKTQEILENKVPDFFSTFIHIHML